MKQQLIDDWRQAWKWWSVQLSAVIAVAPMIYEQLGGMREFVPPHIFHYVMAALGILTIIGRLANQSKKDDTPRPD